MTNSFKRILKLLLFYAVFYSIVVVFWITLFFIFNKTLDDNVPKWQLGQSLLGETPALGVKPISFDQIIRYKAGDPKNYAEWVNQLEELLEPYEPNRNKSSNVQNCFTSDNPGPNKVCDFKLTPEFAPCLRQFSFGFESLQSGPCIFLKLNKLYGWTPEYYHRDNVPEEMPHYLVEIIKGSELINEQYKVWVDCVPIYPTDGDSLGPISYYPHRAFDGRYFPFLNTEGYLSPLVAVYFEAPKRGVLLKVECKTWAYNIDVTSQKSSVRFGLYIE